MGFELDSRRNSCSILLLLIVFILLCSVESENGTVYSTYYASDYNILNGTYLFDSVPASVQGVDSDYFIVGSSPSATPTSAYNPSAYNLFGSTSWVSGTIGDLVSNNGVYMTFRSYASVTSGQTLYSHQETTTLAGETYYLLKLSSADASGTTLSADAGTTTGRKLMGKFLYQLTGVSSIPASTWTIYYRAYQGHVNVEAHGDVDILVRMSNGTIRSTIATNAANSGALTTSYSTVSGTYSWAAYTVVNQTDYLEIDYYIEVTTVKAGYLVYLRIDDDTLAVADQTRAANVIPLSEFTTELEFTGTSNAYNWTQLVWTVDSAWTTGNVSVTLQLYNYTLGAYPTIGNGYISYVSSATANTDETKNQTITTNPADFRDATGNWKIKVKGVKTTTTQFDFKADLAEFKPTYSARAQSFDWVTVILFALPVIFGLLFLIVLKLKRKKKTKPGIEKKTDPFSKSFGMTHQQMIGKKILLEIDPTADYKNALFNFVSEAKNSGETLFIFTSLNSPLYSKFSGAENAKFFLLASKTSSPQQMNKKETLLPASDLSVLLNTFVRIQKVKTEKPIDMLFDNLSDTILICGFEKTYKFIRFLLEAISSPKTTALFVFNPTAHDPATSSSIRGLFQIRLAYAKSGPKVGTL